MRGVAVLFVGLLLACLPEQTLGLTLTGPEAVDGWSKIIFDGNPIIIPGGTTVSFDTAGGLGGLAEEFGGAAGVLATVNVSDATGKPFICLEKAVGASPSGNIMSASIYVGYDSGERTTYGMLLERNPSTLAILKRFILVFLGDPVSAWSNGQDITLGIAVVGQEIWYYTSGCDYLVKVQPISHMTPSDNPGIYIYGGPSEDSVGDITATVSNIYIIYP